jgi:hypothetical protein
VMLASWHMVPPRAEIDSPAPTVQRLGVTWVRSGRKDDSQ